MSKAFDLIDFTVLLHKLSHYRIHGTALKLPKSYLTDRKQYCYYKGTCSSILTPTRGGPQGSILGPIFFLLYINNIPNVTNRYLFLIYANDTTLHSTYDNFHDTNNSDITLAPNSQALLLGLHKQITYTYIKTKWLYSMCHRNMIYTQRLL